MKRALITGITGQDGSYLAEFLLEAGYEVHGIIRRTSSVNTARIEHLLTNPQDPGARLFLHSGDLTDGLRLRYIIEDVQPDEVYNLAAQSHVRISFDQPEFTADVTGIGVLRMLDAVHDYRRRSGREIRFYQAGSSEMFGAAPPPLNENTPFQPRNPYAVSKLMGHWFTVNYREAYGLFACNGILFNHESPRRGEAFVTRKITRALSRIKLGRQKKLHLGNLDVKRDWGFAGDYVSAMWMMLQQDSPQDYLIATGEAHSVREFLNIAAAHLDLDWEKYVIVDPRYLRPTDVDSVVGDASKARSVLGWSPRVGFQQLVIMMVDHDFREAARL